MPSGIPAPRCGTTGRCRRWRWCARQGCRLELADGRGPAGRHLQLVVQVAGPRPPPAARRPARPAGALRTRHRRRPDPRSRWSPVRAPAGAGQRRCPGRLGTAAPRRAGGRGTSPGCSWPTTARPGWRSRSRWRCRRRPSADSPGARASPPSPTATTARPSGALSVCDLGLYGDPFARADLPGARSWPPCPTAPVPTIRAGWIPSPSGRACDAALDRAGRHPGGRHLRAGAAGRGRHAALQPGPAGPAARPGPASTAST